MEWFKHPTNTATHDHRLSRLIAEFGAAGYGRYFLLQEHLLGAATNLEVQPHATYSENQWAKILITKAPNVREFFQLLADEEMIDFKAVDEQIEGGSSDGARSMKSRRQTSANQRITVTLCNYSKLLSSKATPEEKRVARLPPSSAIEKKREEKKKVDQSNIDSLSPHGQGQNSHDAVAVPTFTPVPISSDLPPIIIEESTDVMAFEKSI